MLQIKNLTKSFGGLVALNDVSFEVEQGEIHGLIGPNGAGKSTMFKNIAGFYTPNQGEIIFEGKSIKGMAPHQIAESGLVRTFQETTLFAEMTVRENVVIGCHSTAGRGFWSAFTGADRAALREAENLAEQIMQTMGLSDRTEQLAAELPLGSQRALAMSVALAAKPRIILMDEPFAGMNSTETLEMVEKTRSLRSQGLTIVLVEHDMKAVMGLCDSLTVLNFGQLLAHGTPQEIRNNPDVIAAYLGGSTDVA